MAGETITVVINKVGGVKVKTSGFAGGDCLRATSKLERVLGKKTDDTATDEMTNPVTTHNTIKAGV
jgi:hypothetical protein